jgi:lipopolysaccharide/colanic/teichoic acid biosynthesis glycosyltransferase
MSKESVKSTKSKRGLPQWFNFISSFIGLVILSLLLVAVAVVIKLTSKGPIFFKQKRMGKEFKEFFLYKFRTMKINDEKLKITPKGDPRITKIGKFLRKTKIDELPQLINVLKGDMAIVGPRPEVREYVELNIDDWRKILQVRPGITDPVTLRLRNEEELLGKVPDLDEFYRNDLAKYKIKGYLEYVERRSFCYDLKLIFLTLAGVFVPRLNPLPDVEEILRENEDE